jgi:hypothetical protein
VQTDVAGEGRQPHVMESLPNPQEVPRLKWSLFSSQNAATSRHNPFDPTRGTIYRDAAGFEIPGIYGKARGTRSGGLDHRPFSATRIGLVRGTMSACKQRSPPPERRLQPWDGYTIGVVCTFVCAHNHYRRAHTWECWT